MKSNAVGFFSSSKALVLLVAAFFSSAANASPKSCAKIIIEGEVNAGQEWSASIGQGWVFRLVPIQPATQYSGWDLVVDRAQPAGFPDALFLATPPYGSLNEREIGTTYGLRAQDAIGWNPRSFHFLTNPSAFHDAQQAYRSLHLSNSMSSPNSADPKATAHLLTLIGSAAQGEFHILDSRLVPGLGDPAPYARTWALASASMPHQNLPQPAGVQAQNNTTQSGSAQRGALSGSLAWMRFSVTLWPPSGWHAPASWHAETTQCVP